MNDSPASETAETVPAATPKAPAGYVQDGPRGATFDAQQHGLGVLIFAEPQFGRWRDFLRANQADDPRAPAMMLRALVRRSSSAAFPKPADPLPKWIEFLDEQPYRVIDAVTAAAIYFAAQCERATVAEGNG